MQETRQTVRERQAGTMQDTERCGKRALGKKAGGILNRNMPRHPMVRKYYGFPANFAREFIYNEQALVYSGLLAEAAAFRSESAVLRPEDRTQ
jgi:hypothetical protein